MATETIQSRKVVGQYGCLAFHGLGRERVAIPEPPIRKGSGDDLPQPSEEAKRAYQILCLNKLPCLPSRSKAQVQKNEGNRGNGVQHPVKSKEGNVAGTEVLVQGSRRPPLSPPREQPPPSGHARPENIRHASNVVTTDDNAGRPCPVFGNCQDLKARYQEIDQLIVLQARSFANVDPTDYDAIARLQHRITELFQSKEKIVPDNSKAIQHGTNLPQHDGAHAAGPFNTELQEGRDNGMQCNNYQGHIPGHLSHEGQAFHSEGILGPINGYEHGISEFGGQERIVNPPWQANRAAMALVNLEWVDASNDPEWQREDFPWSNEAKRVNREVFGNQSFRYHQLSIINATMKGRDVFVLMPTGGGKSLCYQLPSVLPHGQNRLKKLTVVISPLISLMQDQAFHLEQLGLKAINLGAGASDLWKVSADVEAGELQVMFLTPEKLTKSNYAQSTIRTLAKQDLLARIVIDEAHCVSQWGHGKSCYIFLSHCLCRNTADIEVLPLNLCRFQT